MCIRDRLVGGLFQVVLGALPLVTDYLDLLVHLVDLLPRPLCVGALGTDRGSGEGASGQREYADQNRYGYEERGELSFNKAVHGLLMGQRGRKQRARLS